MSELGRGKFINLIGKEFGWYEVLERTDPGPSGQVRWLCRCRCGRVRKVISQSLRINNNLKCPICAQSPRRGIPYGRIWNQIVFNGRNRNLEFTINREDTFKKLEDQNYRCALSGIELYISKTPEEHIRGGTTASLDRIDSKKGYLPNNTIWLHKQINQMKFDFPLDRFLKICKLVTLKNQGIETSEELDPEIIIKPKYFSTEKHDFRGKKNRNLKGKLFGYFEVLELLDERKEGSRVWRCRCQCGKIQDMKSGQLTSGGVEGCIKCMGEKRQKISFSRLWHTIVGSAKVRNIPFEVTRKEIFDLLEKQNYRCAMTGTKIWIAKSQKNYIHGGTTASLDRIDSSLFYTMSNIAWLHKDVNVCKFDLPLDRFLELCQTVTEYNQKYYPERYLPSIAE